MQTDRETLTRTANIERMFAESLLVQRRILSRVEDIDRTFAPGAP